LEYGSEKKYENYGGDVTYYNAIAKLYNRGASKNLRYIYFESLRRKFRSKQEKQEYFQNTLPAHTEKAEQAECMQTGEPRDYRHEAVIRAKSRVKEIIRNNFSDQLKLLTLTYANVVEDRKKVLSDIKNMCKRYKEKVGKDLKYICTFEWQKKRHCLHVHMIISSVFLAANMWADVFWRQGFVRVNSISKGKSQSDCLNAISYVLKYIQKDADSAEYYDHVYYRSRNWNMNVKSEVFVMNDEKEIIRNANVIFGNNLYEITRFWFEGYDGTIVNIVDIFPYKKIE
jgi:hypothetical protein